MKLILSSHNKGKLKELKYLLKDLEIEILSSYDFKLLEPEETGSTFRENSLIKAKYAAQQTGILSLADDSGLEIEVIDNQPSIYSKRWAYNGDYNKAFETIKMLMDKANNDRKIQGLSPNHNARFICVLCLYNPINNSYKFFEGDLLGEIVFPPRGENGFGYDSIFVPFRYENTLAEISFEEKNNIAHRYKALNKLREYFEEQKI